MYNALTVLHPAYSTCQIIFSRSLPYAHTHTHMCTHTRT